MHSGFVYPAPIPVRNSPGEEPFADGANTPGGREGGSCRAGAVRKPII